MQPFASRSLPFARRPPVLRHPARSPLMRSLGVALAASHRGDRIVPIAAASSPTIDAAVAGVYDGSALQRASGALPRIVVVGAGLAGLNAASLLGAAGYPVRVFDAASRTGGRVRTDRDAFSTGLVTELGGEFIDGRHADLLALAARFELPLIDTQAASEDALATSWFFGGRHRSEAEVIAAFADLAPRIALDAASVSPRIRYDLHTPHDVAFDRMSLSQYLDRIGASGWFRTLLDVAFATEFGLGPDEQTCLSFLGMIDTDTSAGFSVFGDSDERYKLVGGNSQIVDRLAAPLGASLELDHRLVRVARHGDAYRLDFARDGAATRAVDADIVLLTLPFSLLRQVDLGDLMPADKQACIDGLGYGTNAKVMVGTTHRVWRTRGRSGDLFTDLPMQTGWDASRLRAGDAGALTFYLGGRPGVDCGAGDAAAQASRLTAAGEAVFDGLGAALTGRTVRTHWPSEPFALGSYACWRPGQQTTLVGLEGQSIDRIHFAGEHCSEQFQGYMNGAAESGRIAATRILADLR